MNFCSKYNALHSFLILSVQPWRGLQSSSAWPCYNIAQVCAMERSLQSHHQILNKPGITFISWDKWIPTIISIVLWHLMSQFEHPLGCLGQGHRNKWSTSRAWECVFSFMKLWEHLIFLSLWCNLLTRNTTYCWQYGGQLGVLKKYEHLNSSNWTLAQFTSIFNAGDPKRIFSRSFQSSLESMRYYTSLSWLHAFTLYASIPLKYVIDRWQLHCTASCPFILIYGPPCT